MTVAKPHLSSAYVSRHVSRDEIYQAFPPLFVLQATKAGRGGLGTRLEDTLQDVFKAQSAFSHGGNSSRRTLVTLRHTKWLHVLLSSPGCCHKQVSCRSVCDWDQESWLMKLSLIAWFYKGLKDKTKHRHTSLVSDKCVDISRSCRLIYPNPLISS